MADLLEAQKHATRNRAEIEASSVCGCFYCLHVYPAAEVVAWTGLDFDKLDDPDAADAETALCPRCGSESVLGDRSGYEINAPFLSRMNEAWFQRTIIRKPNPKPKA